MVLAVAAEGSKKKKRRKKRGEGKSGMMLNDLMLGVMGHPYTNWLILNATERAQHNS